MTDIVAAAQAHLASLPQHLKARYSAVLIANLVEEIEHLQELRKLDGESLGKSLEEYNKMKELCVNGRYITTEERMAVMSAVWDAEQAGCSKDAQILLDMANRLSNDSPQLETDGEKSRG
jgi:hypothetical protein